MTITCSRTITYWLFAFSLIGLSVANPANSQPPQESYSRRTIIVPESSPSRRFVRTETQQSYYVDSRGGMHLITREVTESTGTGGILYYIENDDQPYYLDEGQRLYTRDASGNVYYIEDVRPSRINEPRGVILENRPSIGMAPIQHESCSSQFNKCMSGCQGVSRSERYARPECINNCETIRNACRE